MDEEKDFILIEEYLDGTLEAQALTDFEKRLKEDTELSAELALHREMNEKVIASNQKQQLKKEWTAIIQQAEAAGLDKNTTEAPIQPVAKTRSLNFYLVRIAAVALLAVIVYLVWPKSVSNEQLALNYWEQTASFDFTSVDRSTEVEPDYIAQLKTAYQAFEAKGYQKTIALTKAIVPQTEEVLLLEGAASFYISDYKNAIRNFNKVLRDSASTSKDEAMWYLALAYLKSGKTTDALTTLDAIVAQESWKHKEAQELFDKISE